MAVTAFRGLRTTSDFTVTGQRPENWREALLMLNPFGNTPITAMTTMMKSRKVDDPKYHWFEKKLVRQGATITAGDVKTTSLLATGATTGSAGDVKYVKLAAADVVFFRPGHTVRLIENTYLNEVAAKVLDVMVNGASSYITVKLYATVSFTNAKNLADITDVVVNGNVNPENSEMPPAIAYDPAENNNYTQIFRTTLDISRTAMQTHLRTGDALAQLKTDCLLYHGVEMEKAFLFNGAPTQGTGANGKVERTTGGLKYVITQAGNTGDYRYDTAYSGKQWIEGGWDWIRAQIRNVNKYDGGTDGKLVICGMGVPTAFEQLAQASGYFNLSDATTSYGLKVKRWTTSLGVLDIKVHPLMNLERTSENSMFILNPPFINYNYIQDTMYQEDNSYEEGGATSRDGKVEGFLTECGLEVWHPETMGYFTGVGLLNTA